jgi:hypothetical protein
MHDDSPDQAPTPEAQAATRRTDSSRERFRRAQVVATQIARSRAAGGKPSEAEAARLVAEFHAGGGRVTVCPPAEDGPPGTERGRGEPGKRASA